MTTPDPIRAALERLTDAIEGIELGGELSPDQCRVLVVLLKQISAALDAASADGPAVPEGREPAAVATEASPTAPFAPAAGEWTPEAIGDTLTLWAKAGEHFIDSAGNTYMRDLSGHGRHLRLRHPAPPNAGEVGELVAWLRETGELIQPSHLAEHQRYKRAAALLEQLSAQAPPAPAAGEVEELVEHLRAELRGFHPRHRVFGELTTARLTRAATLLEQLSAAPPAPQPVGWQPIDTAPRDGGEILASDCDAIEIVSWHSLGMLLPRWCDREGKPLSPTWWQPLPDHPPLPTTPAGQEAEQMRLKPVPVAVPLKERPDFLSGYRAGLHDGRLQRLSAQAPQPVAVSERPWKRPGWCDSNGRCWFGAPQDGAADAKWVLRRPSERLSYQTVSLPADSLPHPTAPAGQEGA